MYSNARRKLNTEGVTGKLQKPEAKQNLGILHKNTRYIFRVTYCLDWLKPFSMDKFSNQHYSLPYSVQIRFTWSIINYLFKKLLLLFSAETGSNQNDVMTCWLND